VAIPLTSECARPPAAALIEGDQISIVEPRERDPELAALVREAKDSEIAGGGRKGKRAEYHCAACGYGIVVYGQPPSCRCVARHAGSMLSGGPSPSLLDVWS
jgi:hypothetical protein